MAATGPHPRPFATGGDRLGRSDGLDHAGHGRSQAALLVDDRRQLVGRRQGIIRAERGVVIHLHHPLL
jgi:hypothetical protein